ncbi:PKD domain-containing protein [Mucilaginibacter mali]|uniref:PKD domain-containing protein n=1 Tax=Mucilaginibacter mali TaxID=2740462 RepID=A0A7D4QA30_9SPHI|nr:PKD domain-containing protein [Mucilaginibacter mali]QKJ29804.1 PKD domain-containing protein [Mucilaginibacter mali]
MNRYTRTAFALLFVFTVFAISAYAQTVSIVNFNSTTPYSPGSVVTVNISVSDPAAKITATNAFTLYLSQPDGSFGAAKTAIGTVNGKTAASITGTIPYSTTPGSYRIQVEASSPALSSNIVNINIVNTCDLSFSTTPAKGCAGTNGMLSISFTNTSPPGTGYHWDFGDGSGVYNGNTPSPHNFAATTDGSDKVYTVTLISDNCQTRFTQNVTVYPNKPIASIAYNTPTEGVPNACSPYIITVKNKTLGTNASYSYTLKDKNGTIVDNVVKTDNTPASFTRTPITTDDEIKTYTVTMQATSTCGVTSAVSNQLTFTIAPSAISSNLEVLPVSPSNNKVIGCAPFTVILRNRSAGGTSYAYNIYNGDTFIEAVSVNDKTDVYYTFTNPGEYKASLGVFSNCTSGKESSKISITVLPPPAPDFQITPAADCTQTTVNFKNTTPDASSTAPAASYQYTWDFGDGSPQVTAFSPSHTYAFTNKDVKYSVTLTAINANGCTKIIKKTDLISLNALPLADFAVKPDTIVNIPNYHVDIIDKSTGGAAQWAWDFGDGGQSKLQNPSHTYADTGTYKVKLVMHTASGCTDTKIHTIHVVGVPGQLYVPNAFMPTSLTQELRVFTVKGSGIKQWTMRIMNNWGQVIFETNKLNSKGEPLDFWDGKYKGQEAPQGVYAWEISAQFINGTEWSGMSYKGSSPRRSGTLTLIR